MIQTQRILARYLLDGDKHEKDVILKSFSESDFTDEFSRNFYKATKFFMDRGEDPRTELVAEYFLNNRIDTTSFSAIYEYITGVEEFDFHVKRFKNENKRLNFIRNLQKVAFDSKNHSLDSLVSIVDSLKDNIVVESDTLLADLESDFKSILNPIRGDFIKTGFHGIDRAFSGGLNKEEMIILAGRPGMGKSGMATSLALSIAKTSQARSIIFCAEMSSKALMCRIISNDTGINSTKIFKKYKYLPATEKQRVIEAHGRLFKDKTINISSKSNLRVIDIKNEIIKQNSIAKKEGLKPIEVIFVDHIGIITPENPNESRNNQIGQISRDLRNLSEELKLAVVTLCQLNRENEGQGKPKLHNLRDSGNIEQDGASVIFCYRPNYYDENREVKNEKNQEAFLLFEKNRNGSTGELEMIFDPETITWKNHYETTEYEDDE